MIEVHGSPGRDFGKGMSGRRAVSYLRNDDIWDAMSWGRSHYASLPFAFPKHHCCPCAASRGTHAIHHRRSPTPGHDNAISRPLPDSSLPAPARLRPRNQFLTFTSRVHAVIKPSFDLASLPPSPQRNNHKPKRESLPPFLLLPSTPMLPPINQSIKSTSPVPRAPPLHLLPRLLLLLLLPLRPFYSAFRPSSPPGP